LLDGVTSLLWLFDELIWMILARFGAKFDGMIPEPLSTYYESFTTIAKTILPHFLNPLIGTLTRGQSNLT